MFEVFEQYLIEKAGLNEQEIAAVRAVSVEKKLRKRQYLLQEGDVCVNNCFVVKGCLRLYLVGENGTEHMLRFAVENWWMSDQESLNNGIPSKNNIDALEDSELILISQTDYIHLQMTIPKLRDMVETLKARSFEASQRRIVSNISFSAEEKYQHFINTYPDIFYRIPLHMIASYLGISRETLSRVRNHFLHK
ncbi:Crp/Fnr family transcriptional regulator [Chitinophaga pinensis]|uniref:Transcriptional regulator, Crp/Fnr family n=1 Tax=Chitinophaga pinensis (strain ATCC 43595 / DSM 2588 / LMG 13176 / NBRC 15968 / NCIMB 11800 / UQM 2034) TaxID=485918 RepID=A0A979G490_CHIPD|nr:Crp/Fnr family transcriptional regulator [Chitinophaga pinensis]ACU60371.1 putative transcriptional regulator, Crp/Fnr family [Chitinophaga pinensis DSM 2588]